MIKNQNHLGALCMILSVLFFSFMDCLIKLTATDFAVANQETLILVTADHATGGLVLQRPKGSKIPAQWTTGSHDLSPINIYAYGPGAEIFSGVMDNTEIFDRILQALDYENLDSANCSS